ncbi:hypothetical protein SEA_PHRANN_61 [Mycobacterium phage Phrann]|uniref:DnaC-like helicase loader n=6 Tax=Charlievirus TaxID=1623280 RepID=A0AA48ZM56_9CAUD|nr:hypothetical protein CL59_gp62 [Mycobacterium phage Redi]YP_009304253.1 hypothetical protein BJD68_gp61 [Mycobacterium phage Phrann]YP_010051856.1 hypothetical protein KD927_gp55 [Mycobacterium phage Raymond7]QAY16044.1 hypothetical protein SEA_BABERUTH_62 [Mycobacterium phage BabeRuth]QBI99258.1 hypothetical protein SEA_PURGAMENSTRIS_62 [Mycobacterium phage Purgamenstris]QBI99931.1 hypothetical protein SEA_SHRIMPFRIEDEGG_62 [Mycobacterium phage ShrimpFriedEgg]AEN79911.1 hypothetical prote
MTLIVDGITINASPDTVRAIGQVLKLAAILDDRVTQADAARIAAWSEQVERHKLTESDLLDGLQAFYDSPADHAIGIGDLIHHARTAKRVRVDRETAAEREARRKQLDRKAAPEETAAIAAAVTLGPVEPTDRLEAAKQRLQTCVDRASAIAAIREYFAAKAEAQIRARNTRNGDSAPVTLGTPENAPAASTAAGIGGFA